MRLLRHKNKMMLGFALMVGAMLSEAANASCYSLPETKLLSSAAAPGELREIIFLVDQTVALPQPVRDHIAGQIERLAVDGTRISFASFSAFTATSFPTVPTGYYFETNIQRAKESSVSIRALKSLRTCLAQSRTAGIKASKDRLASILSGNKPTASQSDIMSSLNQFGAHLRSLRAPDKIIVLVSDMLENSSTTSFYTKGGLKDIDMRTELQKAANARLLADFAGAKVYVIGAGLFPDSVGAGTRADNKMQALENFWANYFMNSRARLIAFGRPLLLQPIR